MNCRTFFGSMISIIWVMIITMSPAMADLTMTSKTTFEPVYVGPNQRNHIFVVNNSDGFNFNDVHTNGDNKYLLNRVLVKAFDPNTGDLLDEREFPRKGRGIEPGKGESITITDTYPQAHPSLVVVLVEFSHISNGDAVSGGSEVLDVRNANELPFIVTSLLVSRNHGTVLQVKGSAEFINIGVGE